MQDHAHVVINGEKIKVLRRAVSTGVYLKIRTSGSDGMYLPDESVYLTTDMVKLEKLRSGAVITL